MTIYLTENKAYRERNIACSLTSFHLDIKVVLITNLMFNTGAYISSNFKITAVVDGP